MTKQKCGSWRPKPSITEQIVQVWIWSWGAMTNTVYLSACLASTWPSTHIFTFIHLKMLLPLAPRPSPTLPKTTQLSCLLLETLSSSPQNEKIRSLITSVFIWGLFILLLEFSHGPFKYSIIPSSNPFHISTDSAQLVKVLSLVKGLNSFLKDLNP